MEVVASSQINVRVQKRPEASFSETIAEIRSWLDEHNCQFAPITPVATRESGLGFEISFRDKGDAAAFLREFALRPAGGLCEIAGSNQSAISDRLRTTVHEFESRAGQLERARSNKKRPKDRAGEAAAFQELSESITASGNYLAAAERLFAAHTGLKQERLAKIIEKALGQSERASDAVRRLRRLFRDTTR